MCSVCIGSYGYNVQYDFVSMVCGILLLNVEGTACRFKPGPRCFVSHSEKYYENFNIIMEHPV